jgi:hypothetical protein
MYVISFHTCMQAAYNWALAAYWGYGKHHPETKAALAATKAADRASWVPKLLAGLSFPPATMAPASVPGSKMEAAVSPAVQGVRMSGCVLGPRAHLRQTTRHAGSCYAVGVGPPCTPCCTPSSPCKRMHHVDAPATLL